MEHVIDIVKVLGKCGHSFRGHRHEATYNLEVINLGNFLELILLLSKYNICLQEHFGDCIEKSEKQMGNTGKGSLATTV